MFFPRKVVQTLFNDNTVLQIADCLRPYRRIEQPEGCDAKRTPTQDKMWLIENERFRKLKSKPNSKPKVKVKGKGKGGLNQMQDVQRCKSESGDFENEHFNSEEEPAEFNDDDIDSDSDDQPDDTSTEAELEVDDNSNEAIWERVAGQYHWGCWHEMTKSGQRSHVVKNLNTIAGRCGDSASKPVNGRSSCDSDKSRLVLSSIADPKELAETSKCSRTHQLQPSPYLKNRSHDVRTS